MTTFLVLCYGDQTVYLPLKEGAAVTLGRDELAPILKYEEEVDALEISRAHFTVFLRKGDQVAIVDGSENGPSTNGTWLNGQRILTGRLHSQDKIGFWEGDPMVVVAGLCDNFRLF